MLKQVVTGMKMVPLVESVHIPFFTKFMDDQEQFNGDESLTKSAKGMLDELAKWAEPLAGMRKQ